MFKNYLKIAFRNLWRQKAYSFINIVGLAIGITVCFSIFLWVQDEVKHDRFHEKSERIYRSLWEAKVGDNEWIIPDIPVPVGRALEHEFPEVEQVTNMVVNGSRAFRLQDEFIQERNVIFSDENIFKVFDFSFISGDPETALDQPNNVILTNESAQKYFGDQQALGQTLETSNGGILTVTGIVESWPKQSHLSFDFIEPISMLPRVEQRKDHWGSATIRTYFILREGEQITTLQEKLDRYVAEQLSSVPLFNSPGNYTRFPSQALTDIHLRSGTEFGMDGGGDIKYVYLFSVIGLFILILACINFINLSTARAANRLREIGLRKVLGSVRGQLARQFLAESFVYVFLALTLSLLVTELSLPFFNDLSGKNIQPEYLDPLTITALITLTILVGFLAGSYPAIHLSSFMPVRALRGQISVKPSSNLFRNSLVVIQFSISIVLIIGTLVVHKQITFMQESQLGFDKEQVIVLNGTGALAGQHDLFIRELKSEPGVVDATATTSLPGYGFDSTLFEPEQPSNYEQTSLSYLLGDYNLVNVLGLNIINGRNFSEDFASDSSAYLINESAVKALGWEEPLGKHLTAGGESGPVIGVVEDFHFESLHSNIAPLVIPFIQWTPSLIAVRVAPGNINQQIGVIQEKWSQFVPQQPFNYAFLDQNLQDWYESEQRIARLFDVFMLLAIVIACLGLFGLTAYAAQKRKKEIGVRKVLGASIGHIITNLSVDFIKLVVIGFTIAVPLAWFLMNKWLADFAYRIEMGAGIFLLAGLAAVLIALLTVSWQSIKAAVANPVDSLRNE